MKTQFTFPIVVVWLFAFAAALICCGYYLYCSQCAPDDIALAEWSILSAGAGGFLYCLRATYLNYCVFRDWQEHWLPWYFIRPFASLFCGGISMVFLKAGLLLLDASDKTASTHFGYYAFAFIAGFNVDNFLSKLEEVAQTTWGIAKSRANGRSHQEPENN